MKCRFPVAVHHRRHLPGTIGFAQKRAVIESTTTTPYSYPFTTCYAGTADEFDINEAWVEIRRDMTRYDKNEPAQKSSR